MSDTSRSVNVLSCKCSSSLFGLFLFLRLNFRLNWLLNVDHNSELQTLSADASAACVRNGSASRRNQPSRLRPFISAFICEPKEDKRCQLLFIVFAICFSAHNLVDLSAGDFVVCSCRRLDEDVWVGGADSLRSVTLWRFYEYLWKV